MWRRESCLRVVVLGHITWPKQHRFFSKSLTCYFHHVCILGYHSFMWKCEKLFTGCIFAVSNTTISLRRRNPFFVYFWISHRSFPKNLTLFLVVLHYYHPKLYAVIHIIYSWDLYLSPPLLKLFIFSIGCIALVEIHLELRHWCYEWYKVLV